MGGDDLRVPDFSAAFGAQAEGIRGDPMSGPNLKRSVVLEEVSKFYGEVLGVNRISLAFRPGITGLVGPNGAGKSTLMNLIAGLLKPSRGRVRVWGMECGRPEDFFRKVGYCAQFDSFPRGMTGLDFVSSYLRVHGFSKKAADERAALALSRVGMEAAGARKVAAYSKGMRQRIKLAQAVAHDPQILILDEPLNGLDPMARAEAMDLFREMAEQERLVLISSHILHELDQISDRVVMIDGGYVVADGEISEVRNEIPEQAMQILIRCPNPAFLASKAFEMDHVVEARIQEDQQGLLIRTRDADRFFLSLNRAVLEHGLELESVGPADESVGAVYEYLIGGEGRPR
jgi:ABC-2 type transport system ATP-binding protein